MQTTSSKEVCALFFSRAGGSIASAMDRLQSEKDNLGMWLSSDPDHILDQCGDILSMNECKEVQKQTGALEKTKKLVNIVIEKGEGACQSFLHILQQNKGRYQDLHRFFSPPTHGSPNPTIFADGGSVVTARKITNPTAKSLSMMCDLQSQSDGNSPRNAVVPHANYTACNSSVICNDIITDAKIDGDINLSVSIRPPQQNLGTANDPGPSQMSNFKAPAVRWIIEHKVELITCLMTDDLILQYVHERDIVTDRQYNRLKDCSMKETKVTELIDLVIGNGQEICDKFLRVLREDDVLKTYPQLKNILN